MPKTMRHDWTLETRSGSRSLDDAHRVWECYRQVLDDAPDQEAWITGVWSRAEPQLPENSAELSTGYPQSGENYTDVIHRR